MRPLNGKCAMTPEETRARRKELNRNPFHHELEKKTRRKWYAKVKDARNARRRERYAARTPEEIEASRQREREYRAAHREEKRRAWKKWAAANRAKLHTRDRLRHQDPVQRELAKKLRKIRDATPEGRAKNRANGRKYYAMHKHDEKGLRWRLKFILLPRWEKLIDEPPENIERYRRRCTVANWSLFVKWARTKGRYFDPQKSHPKNTIEERRMK